LLLVDEEHAVVGRQRFAEHEADLVFLGCPGELEVDARQRVNLEFEIGSAGWIALGEGRSGGAGAVVGGVQTGWYQEQASDQHTEGESASGHVPQMLTHARRR